MDPPRPTHERIPLWRAGLALLVVALLTIIAVGYHDGAFGTEPVGATDLVEGSFRFKGTITDVDPENGTIRLQDSSGAREFFWLVTRPDVGGTYVVDANVTAQGKWEALAVTKVLWIKGTWG